MHRRKFFKACFCPKSSWLMTGEAGSNKSPNICIVVVLPQPVVCSSQDKLHKVNCTKVRSKIISQKSSSSWSICIFLFLNDGKNLSSTQTLSTSFFPHLEGRWKPARNSTHLSISSSIIEGRRKPLQNSPWLPLISSQVHSSALQWHRWKTITLKF